MSSVYGVLTCSGGMSEVHCTSFGFSFAAAEGCGTPSRPAKQSILDFTPRKLLHRKEISSYGLHSQTRSTVGVKGCFSLHLIGLFCNMTRPPIKAIFTSTSFSSASKRASCSGWVLMLSSWISFCDLALNNSWEYSRPRLFHRNCSRPTVRGFWKSGHFSFLPLQRNLEAEETECCVVE